MGGTVPSGQELQRCLFEVRHIAADAPKVAPAVRGQGGRRLGRGKKEAKVLARN
jgi:hypothetical protein